ncbi:MAG: IclR family transcriptional regulator [Kiritimatiellia bacterium]
MKQVASHTVQLSSGADFLKSADRALDALELLSRRGSLGVSDLARAQKTGTSTAHRILNTLTETGFATHDEETGRYVLGHKLFELTKAAIDLMKPLKYVRPCLDDLRSQCNENSIFAIASRSRDCVLVVAESAADSFVQIRSCLFDRLPLHASACGKAYLLGLTDAELKSCLANCSWKNPTRNGPRSLTGLGTQLRLFRKNGYTVCKEEFMNGISSVGSPVCDCNGDFAGALGVIGPSSRLNDRKIRRFGRILQQSASKLSLHFKANAVS